PLPITLVISQSARALPVAVPQDLGDKTVSLTFKWESEGSSHFNSRPHEGYWPLPADLPLGYHRLELRVDGQRVQCSRLIVCPDHAYQPEWLDRGRTGGIALSLYAV